MEGKRAKDFFGFFSLEKKKSGWSDPRHYDKMMMMIG